MVLNGMFTIRLAQYREMAILSSKCVCVHKRIVLKNGPFLYGCQGRASAEERLQYFLPYQHHHHPYMDIRVNSRKPNLFKHRRPQPLHYDAYHSYYLLPQMRNKVLERAGDCKQNITFSAAKLLEFTIPISPFLVSQRPRVVQRL